MLSLLSEVNAAVWEHSRVRHLYRNTLMTDFSQVFQNDHNSISDAVERDQSAASQVSRLRAQSYMIFDALGGIYLQNAFPSSIIHINPFSYKSKTTSSEHKYFFAN